MFPDTPDISLKAGKTISIKAMPNIPDENIVFVKEKSDKLIFLEQLRDKLQIPENKIAIVEDTVKTLDKIAKAGDYITVHVSSFLM